ncbi:hypothetical protein BCF55_0047 [Hydrogenivirga caldilitoris]|uniref:Uncharacterized protein n=1 Tax=Hydrogenivirga caldilitoris TaxID=246264 RepID=A0A497XNF7_9AQUI|nr:hypothetical protein [Hydrogenivirga caldilitoris]RLJ69791.1 hypothetical protein BCF55_0047 [Hydrogenivirga caldilitoris]
MVPTQEVIREAYFQLSILSSTSLEVEALRELNYKVRKVAERLIALSKGREDVLHKAVDLYTRLGENYELINIDPELAAKTLEEAIRELEKLIG